MKSVWARYALIIASAASLVALAGCSSEKQSADQAAPVRDVKIETLRVETVPDEVEAPGTVQSVATAQLAARTMGTVTQIFVREGDAVERGQDLMRLDDRELYARRQAAQSAFQEATAAGEEVSRGLAASQAQADVARKTYERYVYLKQQNAVSPQEFDEVEARQRAAEANLAATRAKQAQVGAMKARAASEAQAAETVAGYARVVAPFDGVVVRRQVEPGSMVMPGMPLIVVEDRSKYRMEVTVDAARAVGIVRGASARVRLDAMPDRSFSGKVAEIEAGAESTSQTLRVKIDLPTDAALRSGLFGRAWFPRGERKALALPRTAIIERGQLRGVYALDKDHVARLRLVTLGAEAGDHVEILSGLSEGESVLLDPAGRELDGRKVMAQ